MTDSYWVREYRASCFRIREEGTMVERLDGRLKIPNSTRYPIFIAEEAPWVLEPMRAISDPNVRQVHLRGPAGSAKSLVGQCTIADVIETDPGPLYYVWQTDEDGKDAMEDWIFPMLEANEFLCEKLPVDRHKKRMTKVSFPTMPLYSVGANASAAQSKRIKYLIIEEPHLYDPGMLAAFYKRVEGVRNSKIITLSTGSVLGDESDDAFNGGTCEEWTVPCPHCRQFQSMIDSRDRLKSDQNENTLDDHGNFIWHKILPTVRYNCEHCGRDWPTDQAFRRKQAQEGRYEARNLNGRQDVRSFHWEASSVHWVALSTILEEKLKASLAAKRGAIEPLKDYIQKRRALAWDEAPQSDSNFDLDRMKGAYVKKAMVEEELSRFLTFDNQHGRMSKGEGAHRWFVCRSYTERESFLIDEGRISTWEDCEELRISLKVAPARTLVDCAWDTQAVQAICVRYGWQGLWGEMTKRRSFPHHEIINGVKMVRQMPFSSPQFGHAGIWSGGQRAARYYFWCSQPIRELYQRLRTGMATYKWSIPADISSEYLRQTDVEFKRQEIDTAGNKRWIWARPAGKDDHLLDADQMNLVAALLDPRIRQILYGFLEETEIPVPPVVGQDSA